MPSDLNAVNVDSQSKIDVVQTKNLGIVSGKLNHLEMLSPYTVPGVSNSIAQHEEFYREYLHAEMQQYGNDQGVGQPNSQLGSGVENPVNQGQVAVRCFAPISILPPMHSPRPPTPVMAPTNFIFVHDPCTNLS